MHLNKAIKPLGFGWLPWWLACCFLIASAPAQTNDPSQSALPLQATNNVTDDAARTLAAQIQTLTALQAQQEAALKEMQQARQEIAAALAASSSNNAVQLAAITETIDLQRKQDLKAVRDTQRVGLALLVCVSGMLLVSILILNVTSIRAISRMTKMLTASAFVPGSEAQALADVREAQNQMLLFPGAHGTPQLNTALRQLQDRIESLENLADRPSAGKPSTDAGSPETKATPSVTPAA